MQPIMPVINTAVTHSPFFMVGLGAYCTLGRLQIRLSTESNRDYECSFCIGAKRGASDVIAASISGYIRGQTWKSIV